MKMTNQISYHVIKDAFKDAIVNNVPAKTEAGESLGMSKKTNFFGLRKDISNVVALLHEGYSNKTIGSVENLPTPNDVLKYHAKEFYVLLDDLAERYFPMFLTPKHPLAIRE